MSSPSPAPRTVAFLSLIALALPVLLPGCKEGPLPDVGKAVQNIFTQAGPANADSVSGPLPSPVKDPALEAIYAFRLTTRQAYNQSRFDELEKLAQDLRRNKELCTDGKWKIGEFYTALECQEDEPESLWEQHDRIHRAWIAAKPESITARVAYASFLVDYAWHARGSGWAKDVTPTGWKLFGERLAAARTALENARQLPEKDPYWWIQMMTLAKGQGWNRAEYDALYAEAKAFEPTFWRYDTSRAQYLLPRWHGKRGEWEKFAEKTADDPNGLGNEGYARVVIALWPYYDDLFAETDTSWPRTLEGLRTMHEKYPDSLELLNFATLYACQVGDQSAAREMFEKMGDRYLPGRWYKQPARFAAWRQWANGAGPKPTEPIRKPSRD